MNIVIVSNSFIFREALFNIFKLNLEEYNIQTEENINKLIKRDLDNIECLVVDVIDEYIEIVVNLKIRYKNMKIVVVDTSKKQQIYTELIKVNVNGYILDMSDEDEFIYKINTVIKGKKHYDMDLLNSVLSSNFIKDTKELTARELEIIEYVGEGFSNKEISKRLYISESTVKKHISSILAKLDFKNRKEVIIYAKENHFKMAY